jgi:hypothetical protein
LEEVLADMLLQDCISVILRRERIRGKVKFSLEQAMKAQRGSRYIALLFL